MLIPALFVVFASAVFGVLAVVHWWTGPGIPRD
jgi:hypothetical protein